MVIILRDFSNEGDIGMANYEKRVEQEAAYPIPISLYNCYRTVRHEKRGIILLIVFLMPHCPVTVVQRYKDGVCSLLFHSFFMICHPYIPLHLEEICNYHFLLHYLPSLLIPCSRIFFVMQHAGIELGPHRYDATLLTSTCYTCWS